MLHSPRQIRLALFIVAGLLGLAATYIRFADLLPLEPSYVSSATYRSDLLADTLSMYAVRSVVESPEFQRAAGARIEIASLPGEPTGFRLSSQDQVQQRAESALDHARELLRIKLRALALAEVEASRGYLEQLRDEARLGRRAEAAQPETHSKPAELAESVLTGPKKERASLLRREVDGLEKFLRYQERPDWFEARVDNSALRSAQRDVEDTRTKLLELREVFTANSSATKAQAKLLQKKRSQLQALEKHLANALLRSHRNELKGMEASALVAVKQAEAQAEPIPTDEPTSSEARSDDDWLSNHYQQLASQAKTMEKKASLRQLSDASTQLTHPLGYWLSSGLWLASLGLLLLALFVRPSSRSKRTATRAFAPVEKDLRVRSGVLDLDCQGLEDSGVEQLVALLASEANRPEHVLVLGQHGQARSSLSLRLAQRLSAKSPRVRLVDFDFQSRPLSERVGDPASPGVSDFLTTPGPADEFFASLPGTSIQFAPAGTLRELKASSIDVTGLFTMEPTGLTVIDASFLSPLHLVIDRIDAVVCLYQQGASWDQGQSEVLGKLRASGVPIWGIAQGSSSVSRFF